MKILVSEQNLVRIQRDTSRLQSRIMKPRSGTTLEQVVDRFQCSEYVWVHATEGYLQDYFKTNENPGFWSISCQDPTRYQQFEVSHNETAVRDNLRTTCEQVPMLGIC